MNTKSHKMYHQIGFSLLLLRFAILMLIYFSIRFFQNAKNQNWNSEANDLFFWNEEKSTCELAFKWSLQLCAWRMNRKKSDEINIKKWKIALGLDLFHTCYQPFVENMDAWEPTVCKVLLCVWFSLCELEQTRDQEKSETKLWPRGAQSY